jgi:hypothetical protein
MKLKQKMFQFIEDWKKSGLTKVEFIKNTGITIHKFNYWIDKYSLLKPRENKDKLIDESQFQEINLPLFSENSVCKTIPKKLLELETLQGLKITIFEQCLV